MPAPKPPSPDAAAVLALARSLGEDPPDGAQPRRGLLRGKRIGLVCGPDEDQGSEGFDAARLFREAAEALGASVSRIPAGLDDASPPRQVADVARLLGRLYDAVECQDVGGAWVGRLAAAADIPVFAGLARQGGAVAGLSAGWGDDTPPAERHRLVLQAMLLAALG